MNCIMTILTVLSVFDGSQWNDIEVSTNSKFTLNMNEQISSKIEMLTENLMKTEIIAVKCGDDIYSATSSTLTLNKE